jgi:plasmid maintenance system killer protein
MIKSFRDRETGKIWSRERSAKLPGAIQERALMKLQQLHAAGDLEIVDSGLESAGAPERRSQG